MIGKISGYNSNYNQNRINFTGGDHFLRTAKNEYAPLCHSLHEYLKNNQITHILNNDRIMSDVNLEFTRLLPLERNYSLFAVLDPKKHGVFCEAINAANEGEIVKLHGFLNTVDAMSQADDDLRYFAAKKDVIPVFCEIFTREGARTSRKNIWYYTEHIFPMDSEFRIISKKQEVIKRKYMDGLFVRSTSNPVERVKMEYILPQALG